MDETGTKSLNGHSNVVLFDGVCNLCNGLVRFIVRHDKKGIIRFSQLQSASGQLFLKPFSDSIKKADSVIYVRGGRVHLRSSAALYILKDLGGIWKLSAILFIVPRFLRDFLYDLIARYRYRWFGKRESCMIPEPEILQRFI